MDVEKVIDMVATLEGYQATCVKLTVSGYGRANACAWSSTDPGLAEQSA